MLASIIIRTYNEQRYLERLITAIKKQKCALVTFEIVIVDSGSFDHTLDIAKKHDCRITHIKKDDFTFGRSLNIGCQYGKGDLLVFVSGHCIPANEHWLDELCKPLIENLVSYTYGRQIGKDTTKYSESQHFKKWFPEYTKLPQEGFFCNNANAAIIRETWEKYKFNEELTGLEDMYLAQQLTDDKGLIGYISTAAVYHIHDEGWKQVRIRYEREAYALQKIMPEVHISLFDFVRFFFSGILSDFSSAITDKKLVAKSLEIVLFRFNQYWGSYKGNHELRKLSGKRKNQYFYPKHKKENDFSPLSSSEES